jgi:hypothetical protein
VVRSIISYRSVRLIWLQFVGFAVVVELLVLAVEVLSVEEVVVVLWLKLNVVVVVCLLVELDVEELLEVLEVVESGTPPGPATI